MDQLEQRCHEVGIALRVSPDRWDVVLDAPSRRNSQTPSTWRVLAAVGEQVQRLSSQDQGPRVVVLSATGPSFSAGLDRAMFTGQVLGEPGLPQLAALPDAEVDRTIAEFQRAFTWWRDSDALTVAAVQGHAIGAGFQLALGCDLRVVTHDVSFAMKETTLGLVPDLGGTGPLVQSLGYARALEVCLSGRSVGAPEAVATGLAVRAVPNGDLSAAVDELVAAVLTGPRAAVTATKHLLAGARDRTAGAQLAAERLAQAGRLAHLAGGTKGARNGL